MKRGGLGKVYTDGETIVRQGETGDCMYVIQQGEVEVLVEDGGRQSSVTVLREPNFFGEMAIFERELRSATVRARGEVRVLRVDRRNFLAGISEDPSLAFRVVETMSRRIRDLTAELVRTNADDRRDFRRLQVSLPVSIVADEKKVSATLHNLSLLGAFVRANEALEEGQQVVLRIPGIKDHLDARVIHKSENGGYGLQFTRSCVGGQRELLDWLEDQVR